MYRLYVYNEQQAGNADGEDALQWVSTADALPEVGHRLCVPGAPTLVRMNVCGDAAVCFVRYPPTPVHVRLGRALLRLWARAFAKGARR